MNCTTTQISITGITSEFHPYQRLYRTGKPGPLKVSTSDRTRYMHAHHVPHACQACGQKLSIGRNGKAMLSSAYHLSSIC